MEPTAQTSDTPATANIKNRKGVFPESLLKEYARFLVPIIKDYYASEQGKREFAEWQAKYGNGQAGDNPPAVSS